MLEQKLMDVFKEYLDGMGKSYNQEADLKELTEIIKKCNTSAPNHAIGALFSTALER